MSIETNLLFIWVVVVTALCIIQNAQIKGVQQFQREKLIALETILIIFGESLSELHKKSVEPKTDNTLDK